MQAGSSLVSDAGHTMARIMAAIREAAQTMTEITSATQAQNEDIGQISSAVSRLDQMTQQNSALVEESAAASESLKHQAQELAQLISQFVLPSPAAPEPAHAAARAPTQAQHPTHLAPPAPAIHVTQQRLALLEVR